MRKTQLAIWWGLAVLLVALLGALGFVLARTEQRRSPARSTPLPPAAPSVYRLPKTPYTAQSLYDRALEFARRWQPDAAMISATASWRFATLDDLSRPVDWTFQFYSPATQRAYVVHVDQANVSPIRETLSPYSLPTIAVDEWQVDSHQALNAWLNRGGGAFIKANPIVDVSIRLAQAKDGGPVWTVLGLDDSGQDVWTERVEAASPLP